MQARIVRTALGIAALAAIAGPAQAQRDYDQQRWDWTGRIDEGRTVYVRNLNGAVRIEAGTSSTVEVSALKRAGRRGNVDEVKITAEQRSGRGDVVICAVWNSRTRCDEDGYSTNSRDSWFNWNNDRDNGRDVSVEFTVRVPRGVRIVTSTVNGGLDIDGVDGPVRATTVNGSVVARSNGGPVEAKTVNGSLTIRTGRLGRESLDYSTVNGQITLEIPENTDADVELRTVNGSINTDFPLTIEGRFNNRRVRGAIGRGGPLVRLSTTNGSIRLRRS
jgi:hypothetical protein